MITTTQFLTAVIAAGCGGASFLFAFSIYLTASSFRNRVEWKPTASLTDRWRVLARHTFYNAKWSKASVIIAYGFAAGASAAAIVLVLSAGFGAIFL